MLEALVIFLSASTPQLFIPRLLAGFYMTYAQQKQLIYNKTTRRKSKIVLNVDIRFVQIDRDIEFIPPQYAWRLTWLTTLPDTLENKPSASSAYTL